MMISTKMIDAKTALGYRARSTASPTATSMPPRSNSQKAVAAMAGPAPHQR